MKYHQLEAFYQVMLTGSISQAAKNLGRTQPAVSMTINGLEDQLAAKLFDRHAGRITPRAEAKVLFEQICPVMQQLRDIRIRFNRLEPLPIPRISIIAASNAVTHLVPSAIAELASRGQEFRVMNGSAATIVSEMENQRHDIGLTDQGVGEVPLNSPLFDTEVFNIPVCAVYPRGLIPAVGSKLSVDDLAGFQICSLYHENLTAQALVERIGSPRVEFGSFFPMACYAVLHSSVAIADCITANAILALTRGTLAAECRIVADVDSSPYFLMRARYRARSQMADHCYETLGAALRAQQTFGGL
ncbi:MULTISPECIES: LysR family transcriptional regulator [unclassified Mesorhizobium]|uniref:LysR family transcriptional regulator n=1 Tax=unclassified Mesorhizobium TaxID=325217 RepID=UPI00112C0013|nr:MULTISPECIES: LysR family transcriptional regulator [unclassified Mesorhizobium]TPK85472.1 LysR family transcriptional regulator [Mesorhizobium sp. B2-4-17]TPK99855.1 LysR family transcriptional regulator [Mesorhizobium sp. B2-4-14]